MSEDLPSPNCDDNVTQLVVLPDQVQLRQGGPRMLVAPDSLGYVGVKKPRKNIKRGCIWNLSCLYSIRAGDGGLSISMSCTMSPIATWCQNKVKYILDEDPRYHCYRSGHLSSGILHHHGAGGAPWH